MRFVRVRVMPKELQKGQCVIESPMFYDEIESCDKKKPRNNLASVNYLREVIAAVGSKYIGDTFNPITDVNVSYAKGLQVESTEQTHEILLSLFRRYYPKMFDAYIEYHLKNRPDGTNLVFFLGEPSQVNAFIRLGFQEVLEKDLLPKKKVGKPAITNEEAAAEKSESVV